MIIRNFTNLCFIILLFVLINNCTVNKNNSVVDNNNNQTANDIQSNTDAQNDTNSKNNGNQDTEIIEPQVEIKGKDNPKDVFPQIFNAYFKPDGEAFLTVIVPEDHALVTMWIFKNAMMTNLTPNEDSDINEQELLEDFVDILNKHNISRKLEFDSKLKLASSIEEFRQIAKDYFLNIDQPSLIEDSINYISKFHGEHFLPENEEIENIEIDGNIAKALIGEKIIQFEKRDEKWLMKIITNMDTQKQEELNLEYIDPDSISLPLTTESEE